ncbi:hypothetical protein D9743_13320, partial [Staphylococcus aureus]
QRIFVVSHLSDPIGICTFVLFYFFFFYKPGRPPISTQGGPLFPYPPLSHLIERGFIIKKKTNSNIGQIKFSKKKNNFLWVSWGGKTFSFVFITPEKKTFFWFF